MFAKTLTLALVATAVAADFCPFSATLENSPCAVGSACATEGIFSSSCMAEMESFCATEGLDASTSELCGAIVTADGARSNSRVLLGATGGDEPTEDPNLSTPASIATPVFYTMAVLAVAVFVNMA